MTTIDPPPIISDDEQDPIGAWKPSESFQSAFDDSSIGQAGNRIAAVMGSERYMQARTLRGMLELGVPEAALGEEQKTLLREYGQHYVDDAARELAASIYAADAEKNQTVAGAAIDLTAEFADNALSTIPQLVYGVASLFSGEAPRSMNEAIGLDGIQAPRVGYYLGALAEKLGGSETPLDDEYRKIARGEEMRQEQRDLLPRLAFGGTAAAGSLHGLLGRGALAPLSRLAGAAEKVTRLERGAAAVGKWAAEQSGAKWLAGLAAKELLVPGLRFGLWEGVANYVDPETGQPMDGMGRLKHAIAGIAWSPVYSAFGALGGAAANRITGSAGVVRAAHAQWLHNLPEESKAAIARAGEAGFSKAWDTFVLAGMPGVAIPLQKRMVAEVAQSAIEAAGFAGTDLAFWSTIIDAFQGEPGAAVKATEMFATNMFTMSMLRFGGSHRALAARQHERLLADLQAALAGDTAKAQRAPAEIPEAPVAEPKPEAKPAEPEPQPQPEAKPAERRVEIPEDPAVTERVEAERLLEFVEARANRLGVAEALTKKGSPERQLWVAYAARIRHWLEGGRDGLRPEFPGQQKPADLVAFEKDIADRRSRAAEYRAKAARGEVEPKQPEAKDPSTRAAEADWDAEQLRGQQQTAEAQKQRAGVDEAVRYHRNAEIAEAKLALDGIGGPTAEEDIRVVSPKKGKPKLVTYRDGKYWQRDLYGKTEWSELPAKQALALRGKDAREPIKEQLEIVDQIAKRIFELGDEITPEQLRMLSAAANLTASIDRFKDPGINAALSLAEQVLPTAWEPRHLDLWAQMALRGMSPEAQQAVLEQFAVTPAAPPEKAKQRRQTKVEQARERIAKKQAAVAAAENTPSKLPEPAQEPGSAATTAAIEKGEGSKAAGSVVPVEESALRDIAASQGIDVTGMDEAGVRRALEASGLDLSESGRASGVAIAAITALAVSGAGFYQMGALGHPLTLPVAALAVAVPVLYQRWAKRLSEMIRSPQVQRVFQQQRDTGAEMLRKFMPIIHRMRTLASEKFLTKDDRRYAEATRGLQRVVWDDPQAATTGGRSMFLLYADGHLPIPDDLPREQREILDLARDVMNQGAEMIEQNGALVLNRKTGQYFQPRYRRDTRKLTRLATGDGLDVFNAPGTEAWNAVRDWVAKHNNVSMEEATRRLTLLKEMQAYRHASFEQTRLVDLMPDFIRVNGREIQLFETRPREWAERHAANTSARLAAIKHWGAEAQKKERPVTAESFRGVELVNPTAEQQANRKALEDYITSSPNQDQAIREVVAAMRAHHDLPIDQPVKLIGDLIDTTPGTLAHRVVRDHLGPLQSIWKSLHLSLSFVQQTTEPLASLGTLFGTGTVMRAMATTWFDAFSRPKRITDELRSLAEDVGGAGDLPAPRFGGLSLESRASNRMRDIARMFDLAAAPMTAVNALNNVIAARSAKWAIHEWGTRSMSPGDRAYWDGTLRLLDFTPQERQELTSGNSSPELQRAFIRRIRKDVYGERGRADQGFLQQLRMSRALFPYQGWQASNLRLNGKLVAEFGEGLISKSMPFTERLRRTRRLLRHVAAKGATHAVSMLAYQFLFFGTELWNAYQGETDDETAKNFFSKLGLYALSAEIGGPLVGVIMAMATGRAEQTSLADAVIKSSPLGDLVSETIQAAQGTGTYETARPGLLGIPEKAAQFLFNMVPAAKAADTLAHSPEIKIAVRRFWETFPDKLGGNAEEDRHDEFSGAMRKAVEQMRRAGGKLKLMDRDALRATLLRAIEAPPDADSVVKTAAWERMSPAERRAVGAERVVKSLKARRLLTRLSDEEEAHFIKVASRENYRILAAHDAALEALADFAEMAYQ